MKNETKKIWGGLALAAVLICGCAQKRIVNSEVPNEPTGEAAMASHKLDHYVVRKHDTLWAIAGRSSIYGDSFEWPLIYKTNRDLIQDPDLIYPRQKFNIEKQIDSAEVKRAEKLADDTPQYKPHSEPIKNRMVDYF